MHLVSTSLLATTLMACAAGKNEGISTGITGIDHLADHLSVQNFWVDGYNAAQAGKGGRNVCCATLPRKWRPDLKVQIRWEVADWKAGKWTCHVREVPVEPYEEVGQLWVHFLADGSVPSEQGRGPGKLDEEKLSQLPLHFMYEAAKAAKVPLNRALVAAAGAADPFKIAPNVRQAFEAFMSARQKSQPVREWLVEYLAWRYQVRHHYNSLPWHARANDEDKANLQGANQRLLDDVEALMGLEQTAGRRLDPDSPEGRKQARQQARVRSLEREAPEVHARIKAAPATDAAAAALFADFVHDSYAGFRPFDQLRIWGWDPVPGSWEGEGYLRWCRCYEGTDERFTRNTEPRSEAMPA